MVVPGSIPNMILSSANTPFLRYFVDMPKLSHKATQFLRVLVKLLIVGGASFVIWKYLKNTQAFRGPNIVIQTISILTYSNIGILLLFTMFNWTTEVFKWKTLAVKVRPLSLLEAAIQSLSAHVSALSTPAKLGDYGAKAMYFIPVQRKKVLFLSFLGNFYQMMATLVFGMIGIGVVIFLLLPSYRWYYIGILIIAILIWLMLPQLLDRIQWSFKGFSWQRIQTFTATIHPRNKHRAIGLAFFKYLIFTHQFYFLLFIFDVHLGYWLSMGLISTMYLLSSLLPVMQLLDVVVRGGVAVLVFGLTPLDESLILIITSIMWVLNVAFPMIPGSYFVLTYKPLTPDKAKSV